MKAHKSIETLCSEIVDRASDVHWQAISRRDFGVGLAASALAVRTIGLAPVYAQERLPCELVSVLTEDGHLYVNGRLVASTHGITGDKLWANA